MDQYKISQNPETKKANSRKSKPGKRARAPKGRQTQALNPQLVLGGIVAVLVLVFGGVVWAHFVNKPATPAAQANAGKVIGKSAGSTKTTVIPAKTISGVTDAVGNKKPGDLNRYYAKTVCVFIVRSGGKKCVSASQVGGLISNPLNSAQTPWDWHVQPGDLSNWQTGPYGQYFNDGQLVGISQDGTVISIHFDDNGQIDVIFVAPVGDLTSPGGSGNTSTGTDTTGGGGNNSGTTDTTPAPSGPAGGQNDSD